MSFKIQRLGFDGRRRRWFDVQAIDDTKREAICVAALLQWGSSQDHRVIDADGTVVWPEDD